MYLQGGIKGNTVSTSTTGYGDGEYGILLELRYVSQYDGEDG